MKKEIIEHLLDRYWKCETSLEEEKQLQGFFSGNKVPEEMKKYIPLFQFKNKQKAVQSAPCLKVPYENEKKRPSYFYSVIKVAASFLIFVTLGLGFYTHYKQEQFLDMVLSETYSEPEDAVRHTGEIVAKVSSLLQLIPETVITEEGDTAVIENAEVIKDSLR